MKKTKIDWADSTWNPVTGCLHGCEYCYARRISERFSGFEPAVNGNWNTIQYTIGGPRLPVLNGLQMRIQKDGKVVPAFYPFGFQPTFHRYKLDEPKRWTKPRTIFVCSMADLFGDWVPDEWIKDVFDSCEAAPQHRYIFLTKNPDRLNRIARYGELPQQHWYGYTATEEGMLWRFSHSDDCHIMNLFVSIEPILKPMKLCVSTHTPADWIIIGAETGNRKDKVTPERDWILNIKRECEYSGIPIFMKESLREMMGSDFRQEFPWKGTSLQV